MNLDVWVVQDRLSVKNHPLNDIFQFIYGSYDSCELNLLMIMKHYQICCSFTEWEVKTFFLDVNFVRRVESQNICF